ncbi:50S ribosomal protein L15 [bacterium]|jgi:large subunit ribosomal protein L15|nr:50S ribosomal protein L15 [bacterium]MBT3581157.1 50S ribosomal protein L15 [bacterium]MBT4551590.1 50S ribosomal protein L15 [bacterium]MBT7087808.1 50S ribosomal protein L15 [bacterium]
MSEFKLTDIVPAPGSRKKRVRKGRGNAAGKGGECGRGHKGQKSRSGYSRKLGFEGGQTPLYKRLPKKKGFNNVRFKEFFEVVNLADLEKMFADGDKITPELLLQKGCVQKPDSIKILGMGDVKKKFTVLAHGFSKNAELKINKAGGKIEKIVK